MHSHNLYRSHRTPETFHLDDGDRLPLVSLWLCLSFLFISPPPVNGQKRSFIASSIDSFELARVDV